MANFKELNTNINKVILKLTESQDLCKLLYYQSDDPIHELDLTDTYKVLFMKNIFPFPKNPSTFTEPTSFLTILFDDIQIGTKNTGFKNSILTLNVICHTDKWKIEGALRPYSIMNKIDEILNNQRVIGIGNVQFKQCKSISVNNEYHGYRMEYIITDFS